MVAQKGGHRLGVLPGLLHTQRQRFQRTANHPAGVRIELSTDGAAQRAYLSNQRFAAHRRAGNQIGMAADIFGQRVERDIGAEVQRTLKQRAEQRIVAGDDRTRSLLLADLIGDARDQRDIYQAVGGVSGRLDQNQRDASQTQRLLRGGAHFILIGAVAEADRLDIQVVQRFAQQRLGAAVERLRMQDHIARARKGQQRGGDGRHARREQGAAFSFLINRQAIFDDFAVGMVKARIDQTAAFSFRRLAPSRHVIEEVASLFGTIKNKGRGQKHRRFDRALRQARIVAVVQHLGFRMQLTIANMGFFTGVVGHGISCSGQM